ncbi:hypothetical protein HAX54_048388 [Datura stramonium]|uniref:Uncharacterized protein n=1 Tax=Datura stramonium TaxID=4076 RepID=A0ABS8WLN0_DATST|nr:hypothetical protein [Datura stramonium]
MERINTGFVEKTLLVKRQKTSKEDVGTSRQQNHVVQSPSKAKQQKHCHHCGHFQQQHHYHLCHIALHSQDENSVAKCHQKIQLKVSTTVMHKIHITSSNLKERSFEKYYEAYTGADGTSSRYSSGPRKGLTPKSDQFVRSEGSTKNKADNPNNVCRVVMQKFIGGVAVERNFQYDLYLARLVQGTYGRGCELLLYERILSQLDDLPQYIPVEFNTNTPGAIMGNVTENMGTGISYGPSL